MGDETEAAEHEEVHGRDALSMVRQKSQLATGPFQVSGWLTHPGETVRSDKSHRGRESSP